MNDALCVPYTLYLSPKAGPAAVRFFEWLAENLPEERYPGTPRPDEPLSNAGKLAKASPLAEVLKQNGLLPAVVDSRSRIADGEEVADDRLVAADRDTVPAEELDLGFTDDSFESNEVDEAMREPIEAP